MPAKVGLQPQPPHPLLLSLLLLPHPHPQPYPIMRFFAPAFSLVLSAALAAAQTPAAPVINTPYVSAFPLLLPLRTTLTSRRQ